MSWKRTLDPVEEPVTLDELKANIRLASLWFDENAPVVVGTSVSALPHDVDDLLVPYRMRRPK